MRYNMIQIYSKIPIFIATKQPLKGAQSFFKIITTNLTV